MIIISQIINIQTEKGINIYNVTDRVQDIVTNCGVKQGQVLIFSRHTTTALAINENEERLLIDLKPELPPLTKMKTCAVSTFEAPNPPHLLGTHQSYSHQI